MVTKMRAFLKKYLCQGGWETKDKVKKLDRILFEIRLYSTSEESMLRASIWFFTLMVGAYSYYHLKKPELSIQNYIIMAAAYYGDLHCNKLTQERRKRYWLISNLCNTLLWLITIGLFAMGIVQLTELSAPASIRGPIYYGIMFCLAIVLIIKPLFDSFMLGIFPNSFAVLYKDPDFFDERKTSSEVELNDAYKAELEAAGTYVSSTQLEEEN